MSSLESLPPDQRAVLQLVLTRGRGYDEIAELLAIDRAAVRYRALSAFDALGPQTRISTDRRALITDYLLGQLPNRVRADTRDHLAESASERAWARVIASELASLSPEPLPEIPDEAVADAGSDAQPTTVSAAPEPQSTSEPPRELGLPSGPADQRPSSRRGGAILLGVGALIAVVVVIVVLATSGSGGNSSSQSSTATTPTTASTASTPTTSTTPQVVARLNLVAPSGNAKGLAEILRQGATNAVAIVAQGITPNTKHDAYAVWLYNSPTDSRILGFVNPGVTKTRRLSTAGALPADANHFKHLLITRETQQSPHAPGLIVLEGALGLG